MAGLYLGLGIAAGLIAAMIPGWFIAQHVLWPLWNGGQLPDPGQYIPALTAIFLAALLSVLFRNMASRQAG